MYELDCCGLSCPVPVVKTKRALAEYPQGLDVLVDNFAAKENVSRFACAMGYNVQVKDADGIWTLQIRR